MFLRVMLIVLGLGLLPALSHAASVGSDDVLVVDGELKRANGKPANVRAWGSSTVVVKEEGGVRKVKASEEAKVRMEGGSVKKLIVLDNAAAVIQDGAVKNIKVASNARVVLRGVENLKKVRVFDQALLSLWGYDLAFDGRFVSGRWADGDSFRFRLVDRSQGQYRLQFNEVPLPGAGIAMASALVAFGLVGRRRKSLTYSRI